MGSGKTEVSKKLSAILDLPLVEVDDLTLKLSGRASVSEIFKLDGEAKFRDFEKLALESIGLGDAIISMGGGGNLELIQGKMIYLKTSFEVITERLKDKIDRPLFDDEAGKLYEKRCPIYEKQADIIIETDFLSVDEVCQKTVKNLNIFMVIGAPVSHSLSPKMHNAGYDELGLDFFYLTKKIPVEDLKHVPDFMRMYGIKGISVTAPHKIEIIKYLDEIEDTAKEIGAVNTLINKNGKIVGYNTDFLAISDLLKNHRAKKVAILGEGGMAKAMAYASGNFKIFSRKLANFASSEIVDFGVIMNATPIGINPDESPIQAKFLRKGQIVFDAVYSQKETRLIREAKEAGAETVNGKEILLKQGIAQFKLFTGQDAPEEVMRKSLT